MKKLFNLTGIFIGIYLIYIFLIYSGSLIFPLGVGPIYDCSVEKNITSRDLIAVSEKYDVTAFTTEYYNTSFFNKDIVFSFLTISEHDTDNIRLGYQDALFPSNKILYEENTDDDLKLQRFWIVQNSASDIEGFVEELNDYGISNSIFESRRMNLSVIFAEKNIEFFACVILLLVFCVSAYYMLRSKEIAIFKLNGYSNLSISTKIIKIAAKRIFISYTLSSIIFIPYLIVKNQSLLPDFVKLYVYIAVCIIITILAVMLIGALFVNFLAIVPALKSDKNSKLLMVFKIAFKICATIVLVLFAKNVFYDTVDLQVATLADKNASSSSLYYIKTSEIPDEDLMPLVLSIFDKIDNNKVYNYSNPTDVLYGHDAAFDQEKKEQMVDNPPIVRMSYNMLDFVSIYSTEGQLIDKGDFDCNSITILIPSNLLERTEEIVAGFNADTSVKVRYIESNQEHSNYLNPSEKTYNAIYFLAPIGRDIYFNNGRVLFHEDVIEDIESCLIENGIDSGTVSLVNLSSDYQKTLSNLNLKLIDDLQFLLVNLLSFLLSVVAIGTVYCEFRKKELSVYKILSVYPIRSILTLCGVNVLVSLAIILYVCPIFFFIAILESIVYVGVFQYYRSKKVVSALKGE